MNDSNSCYGVYGRLDADGLRAEGLKKVVDNSYGHKDIKASVNYTPGEVERRESGDIWTGSGLGGCWSSLKNRGPC